MLDTNSAVAIVGLSVTAAASRIMAEFHEQRHGVFCFIGRHKEMVMIHRRDGVHTDPCPGKFAGYRREKSDRFQARMNGECYHPGDKCVIQVFIVSDTSFNNQGDTFSFAKDTERVKVKLSEPNG